jgi:hypothetical protein
VQRNALKEGGPAQHRDVRLGPVDHLGRVRRRQAVQGRLPFQQPRSQCAALHGVRGSRVSCAPSALTSPWAAMTTPSRPTPLCCGAPTWRRCIRFCGRASLIGASPPSTSRFTCCLPYSHRSCELADNELIFNPQSDLAIMNYICNHVIIQSGAVNEEFVKKHVKFKKGVTDIGYGLRPCSSPGKGGHDQRLPRRRRQAQG